MQTPLSLHHDMTRVLPLTDNPLTRLIVCNFAADLHNFANKIVTRIDGVV